MKIIVNPKYEHLRPFIEKLTLPSFFARNGITLHEGRNVVKRFDVDGVSLVVKSYERISTFNRLVYGSLRKSKAMRAYLYAAKLRNLGIDTPEEVAVVEVRNRGLMRQLYFVSLRSDYKSLRPVTDLSIPREESLPILNALAVFLVRMHDKGVLHNDLNIGNILYSQDPRSGEWRFCVIDINRMQFRRRLSRRLRLKNLRRLSVSMPNYFYILQRYAEIQCDTVSRVQLEGAIIAWLWEWRTQAKQKLKGLLRHA